MHLYKIVNAYSYYLLNPTAKIDCSLNPDCDLFFYNQIILKKYDINQWFKYLSSNNFKLYVVIDHSNLKLFTKENFRQYEVLVAVNDEQTDIYNFGKSPKSFVNPGTRHDEIWIELTDQKQYSIKISNNIDPVVLFNDLLKEIKININQSKIKDESLYKNSQEIFELALTKLLKSSASDKEDSGVSYIEIISKTKLRVLCSVRHIPISHTMGSFLDVGGSMTGKLYQLVKTAYMATINPD